MTQSEPKLKIRIPNRDEVELLPSSRSSTTVTPFAATPQFSPDSTASSDSKNLSRTELAEQYQKTQFIAQACDLELAGSGRLYLDKEYLDILDYDGISCLEMKGSENIAAKSASLIKFFMSLPSNRLKEWQDQYNTVSNKGNP